MKSDARSPEDILGGLIAEMTERLIQLKDQVAMARREHQRLSVQAAAAARTEEEWEQRAMAAVRAGDDVVARDALLRKRHHAELAAELADAEQRQREEVETLKRALESFNERIEDAKRRRNAIVVRAKRLDAEVAIREIVALAASSVEPFELIERMEARVSTLEGEAGLLPELSDEALAAGVDAPESARRVDAELARLKQTLGIPAPPRPLAKAALETSTADARASAETSAARRSKR